MRYYYLHVEVSIGWRGDEDTQSILTYFIEQIVIISLIASKEGGTGRQTKSMPLIY